MVSVPIVRLPFAMSSLLKQESPSNRSSPSPPPEQNSWSLSPVSSPICQISVKEVVGDLFSSDQSLAHCVSADQRQGAGIALLFKRRFGRIDELKAQNKKVGEVAHFKNDRGRFVFTLITKERYHQKPTYGNIRKCLIRLAAVCNRLGVKKLSIPRLGCGLDGLDWHIVKRLILNVRDWNGMEITVYCLQ